MTNTDTRPAHAYCPDCGAPVVPMWEGYCDYCAHGVTPTPGEFGCYSLNLGTGKVCTLEFGHDGPHVAHGPHRVEQTWERHATDRSASEHEAMTD